MTEIPTEFQAPIIDTGCRYLIHVYSDEHEQAQGILDEWSSSKSEFEQLLLKAAIEELIVLCKAEATRCLESMRRKCQAESN